VAASTQCKIGIVAADEQPLAVAFRVLRVVGAAEHFVAGLVFPLQLAGGGFERVNVAVARTFVNDVVENQRRGLDAALGLEGPQLPFR
jgi:hypothetical protein